MEGRGRRSVVMSVVAATALVFGGCSAAETEPTVTTTATTSTTPTVVTTATASATTTGVATTTTASRTAEQTVDAFIDGLNSADGDALRALLAPGAVWDSGLSLVVDDPLPPDLDFLTQQFGLAGGATFLDLLDAALAVEAAAATVRSVSECVATEEEVTCAYREADAFTHLSGRVEAGSVSLVRDGRGQINFVAFNTSPQITQADASYDGFRRWAAVEEPQVTNPIDGLESEQRRHSLLEAWELAGRPDLAAPPADAEPLAVLAEYLDARADGDWETHMRLLGGDALDNPFGSRDEFDAAAWLERRVTAVDCEVTLESATQGTFLACDVAVDDIITHAAGVTPTNPNATTFRVKDGRVIDLPEFLPSLFRAERAIEGWAIEALPTEYAQACPDGVAGQSVLVGASCARFIAEHLDDWRPLVVTG